METNIIDTVIPTNRSRELVRLMIPIMVRWAKLGLTDKTYTDMLHILGYSRYQGIGTQLGNVESVMRELKKQTGMDIPTLNALCKKPKIGIPSDGFDFVYPNYSSLTLSEQLIFVAGLNEKAVKYQYWDKVLDKLGLKPAKIFTSKELDALKKPIYGAGGEGKEHKTLKEYIANHPESVGLKDIVASDTEHILQSGDKLDVYFELKNDDRNAIEVKPSTSPDQDITRGIFQCVKYKAVMDAVRIIDYGSYENKTLFVIAGEISEQNKQLAEDLGVKYIKNFKIK